MSMTKMEIIDHEVPTTIEQEFCVPDKEQDDFSTIDLLDRQEFVDKVINIVEILSEQQKNACFAINGGWGVGKSFVLKMIEEQLSIIQNEDTAGDKYIIFHYNCWQYDYYEEPIVAIVATLLEQIDDKINIISKEKREIIIGVLKTVGTYLLKKGPKYVKNATGVPVDKALDLCMDVTKEAMDKINEDSEYDSHFKFRKALNAFQKQISSLSENYTVIFIVDELDRCLPEYSIKVLERLHHLFDGIKNTQVILSIDKTQLEHTIENIFGKRDNVNVAQKYLSKFIKFEVDLVEGFFNDNFNKKYSYYINKFDFEEDSLLSSEANEFLLNIFNGIDIRGRQEIIDKCNLLHDLTTPIDELKCPIYMCVELLLTLMVYTNYDFKNDFENFSIIEAFIYGDHSKYKGLCFLNSKVKKQSGKSYFGNEYNQKVVRTEDIWGILLAVYRYIGGAIDEYLYDNYDIKSIINFSQNDYNLLKTIH